MRFAIIWPLGAAIGIGLVPALMAFGKWSIETGIQDWQIAGFFIACCAAGGLLFDRFHAASTRRSNGR